MVDGATMVSMQKSWADSAAPRYTKFLCSSGYVVPLIFTIQFCIAIRANAFVFFVSLKRDNI